jgi:protein-S-isoprenylcysteine O-methyltransferase Ste14
MNGAGPPEPPADSPGARRRRTAGIWVGYLIFALVLLFLIVLTVQYAYQHQWADFTWAIVFTLLFLIIPTGGARWLRRALRDRQSPEPPSERAAWA